MAKVVPPGAPAPQSVLGWDGTDFYVLRVDATGHLQVDALTTALPAGAATAAHQITQITALQLIDNLVGALQSVATDRLKVRGEGQLFALGRPWAVRATLVATAVNHSLDSGGVPAGWYRVVTTMMMRNASGVTTQHLLGAVHDGIDSDVVGRAAVPQNEGTSFAGQIVQDVGDVVYGAFTGCAIGNVLLFCCTGYEMPVEA